MAKKKQFKLPYLDGNFERNTEFYKYFIDTGDICTTIKLSNPVIQFSGSVEAYNGFHSMYSNIVKLLGEGYVLQKHDVLARKAYSQDDAKEFLQQKYNEHFEGREYIDITTYLTIIKISSRKIFSYSKQASLEYNQTIAKVFDVLEQNKTKPFFLDQIETEIFIKRIQTMNFSDDQIVYDNIRPTNTELDFGDQVVRSLSLIDIDNIELPNKIATYIELSSPDAVKGFPSDLFSFLLRVPSFKTIIYNQVITIPNQHKQLLALDQKKRRHSGVPDPANEMCVNDIDDLLVDVAKNNQTLVKAHYNIMVCADKAEIDKAMNFIVSSLFNQGISPSRNAYNQFELFLTVLPGNANALEDYDWFLTSSDAALCFLFKDALPIDEESDFLIRFTDRQGIPIAIDPADLPMHQNRISNRNKFVLGPSGSGKSFLMNTLIEQYQLYPMDVVIVDVGHSYQSLCAYFGGRYITYTEENPITMNPFHVTLKEMNIEKRDFLSTLIGLLWKTSEGKVNGVERDVIASVINSYYQHHFYEYTGLTNRQTENVRGRIKDFLMGKVHYHLLVHRVYKVDFGGHKLGLYGRIMREVLKQKLYREIELSFYYDLYSQEFDSLYKVRVHALDVEKRKEFNDNKVKKLSFDSFYKFSTYKIQSILNEEARGQGGNIDFNFVEFQYVLRKFCTGEEFGQTLNKKVDDSLFEEQFIVFEIDSIKEHKILFPIVTLIIMDVFIQKMRHRGNYRKALIIEEAWKAIASPLMAGYILYLYKTVRKFWGEAIVVTQELSDIIGNATVKDSIINNSDTICLLDQARFKDNFVEIADLLSISEVEKRKVFTINQLDNTHNRPRFKEVYIKRGAIGEVYGVEVSLAQYLTYTTEKPERSAITIYLEYHSSGNENLHDNKAALKIAYENALTHFIDDLNSSKLSLPVFVQRINRLGTPLIVPVKELELEESRDY